MAHTIKAEGGANLAPAAGFTLAAEGGASLGPAAGFALVAEGGTSGVPGVRVTGTLVPDGTGFLPERGTLGGKKAYSLSGAAITGLPPASGEDTQLYWDAGLPGWTLAVYDDAELLGAWTSANAVATPDLVTTWTPFGASTGTPVVTASTSVQSPPGLTAEGGANLSPAAGFALAAEGGASLAPAAPAQIRAESIY